MDNVLIKCSGWIGDNLFASSIAKKLKFKYPNCEVDLLITLPQPYELLSLNPHISSVHLKEPTKQYDKVWRLHPISRSSTPCEQFQAQCGILDPTSDFKVYTNEHLDYYVKCELESVGKKTIVAWLSNWEERSFLFTEEQYERGIDVPLLGYGGKHRDIQKIIHELSKNNNIHLVMVGKPNGTDSRNTNIETVSEYSLTASILKNCDYFIGAEGGLCNLAAGVGTNTIITSDFVHQLYGWNGVLEKCKHPKLGPEFYFPDGHISLDPYLTDDDVILNIKDIVNSGSIK
jgi:hypothetical protein